MNVLVSEDNSNKKALVIDKPRSCVVWSFGVRAVCDLPKKVRCHGCWHCDHLILADVRIPRGHGGLETHLYTMLALDRVEHQAHCLVWLDKVRNDCSIEPKHPQGSMVNGMSTMFFSMSLWMIDSP